ncbi:MAG: phosphotransferase [Pseudomonadota bacterium]
MIERPVEVVSLNAGQANEVLLLKGTNESYVFKWLNHSATFGLDRSSEFELQQELSKSGLAPKVIAVEPELWVLQEYVAGMPASADSLSCDQKLRLAAKALAQTHRQSPCWEGTSLWQKLEYYVAKLGTGEQQQLQHFRNQLGRVEKPVLCHFDLAFAHILSHNSLTIIDWEYAGWGDRITDIASTIEINQLDNSSADKLCYYYQLETDYRVGNEQLNAHRSFVQWINHQWLRLLKQGIQHE